MNKFDHLDLDGRLLHLLTVVVHEGSVTRAAQVLGVTQSAVSHMLDKLRVITGDPLFVRSGRGIVATARAQKLATEARSLLKDMQHFVLSGEFDPARWAAVLTIAANDFQREVLLPGLMHRLRLQAPLLTLRIIPSDIPSLELLRSEACQLVISPRPPDGADVVQKRLFVDRYRVFYDPACRSAPVSKASYLAAHHATVSYAPHQSLDIDHWLHQRGVHRQFVVAVPGFAGLHGFLRGSDLLATAPGRLQGNLLRDLAACDVPVTCPALPMYAIWHVRYQQDPAHRWLRAQLTQVVKS